MEDLSALTSSALIGHLLFGAPFNERYRRRCAIFVRDRVRERRRVDAEVVIRDYGDNPLGQIFDGDFRPAKRLR